MIYRSIQELGKDTMILTASSKSHEIVF